MAAKRASLVRREFQAQVASATEFLRRYYSNYGLRPREQRALSAKETAITTSADGIAALLSQADTPAEELASSVDGLEQSWRDYKATARSILESREAKPKFPEDLSQAQAVVRAAALCVTNFLGAPRSERRHSPTSPRPGGTQASVRQPVSPSPDSDRSRSDSHRSGPSPDSRRAARPSDSRKRPSPDPRRPPAAPDSPEVPSRPDPQRSPAVPESPMTRSDSRKAAPSPESQRVFRAGEAPAVPKSPEAMSREPTDVQAQISQLKAEIAEGQSRNQSATKQVRLLQRESSTWTDAAICRPPESSAELEQLLSDQVRDLTETVGQLNASLAALLGAPDEPARVLRQQVALAEQRERRANDDPKAFSAEVAVAKERRESLSRERYQLEALRLKAVAARRAAVEGFRQARHDLLSVQHQQDEVKRAIDAMADEERDLTAQIQEAEDAIAEIAKQDTRTAQQEEQEELEAEVERLERRSEELSEVTIPALKSELNKVSAEVGHLAKTVAKRYMQLEQLKMELLAEKIEELFPY